MTEPAAPPFRTGWRAFRSHPGVYVAAMLILFASWVALELAVVALHRFGIVPWIVLHLAFLWFASGLMLGLHGIALQAVDGKEPALRELTALLPRASAFLLGLCIYGLAVVVGLALLVVPGIYLAGRYALFGQALAARPLSALGALREAAALSAGRRSRVCGFWLAALVLNLAGAALLGLGLLVTFPVTLLATASLYRSLQRSAPTS
jgi:uncharacterized membrane protein